MNVKHGIRGLPRGLDERWIHISDRWVLVDKSNRLWNVGISQVDFRKNTERYNVQAFMKNIALKPIADTDNWKFPLAEEFSSASAWIRAINDLGERLGVRPMDNLGLLLLVAQGDEARFWRRVVAEGEKAQRPASNVPTTIYQQLEESFKIQKEQIQKEEK